MSEEEFYAELERRQLVALWRVVRGLMPSQPQSRFVPHLWRWKDLQALATSAAELVTVDRAAERRGAGAGEPRAPPLGRWKALQALATSAAELVTVDRAAERRVLGLENPGAPGSCAATPTLWAAVQILLPGEVAPAHRHSQGAVPVL